MEGPFWVTFEVARTMRRVLTPDHEAWSLEDLKDGFWITPDFVICRPSQGRFFIPPSRIVVIEKRS